MHWKDADHGRVSFAGKDVTVRDPGRLYRTGLSRTFQQARVFPQLSVQENLVVAAGYGWSGLFTRRVGHTDRERAEQLLEEFRLARSPTCSLRSCRTASASFWSSRPF